MRPPGHIVIDGSDFESSYEHTRVTVVKGCDVCAGCSGYCPVHPEDRFRPVCVPEEPTSAGLGEFRSLYTANESR